MTSCSRVQRLRPQANNGRMPYAWTAEGETIFKNSHCINLSLLRTIFNVRLTKSNNGPCRPLDGGDNNE